MTINELFGNKITLTTAEKIKALDLIMKKDIYMTTFYKFEDYKDYKDFCGNSLTKKEFELLKKVYKFYKEKENETT